MEYYLANSKSRLIQLAIEKKESISYSIEKQMRKEREYMAIGISVASESKSSVIQWLYIDPENDDLYEYDLSKDKLIRFK